MELPSEAELMSCLVHTMLLNPLTPLRAPFFLSVLRVITFASSTDEGAVRVAVPRID